MPQSPANGSNSTQKKVVIFKTKSEAEAQTGFFRASKLMISEKLELLLERYIRDHRLSTWTLPNQAKTGHHLHTLHFKLTTYHGEKRAYLTDGGALGSYKSHSRKPTKPSSGSNISYDHEEKQYQKYEDLRSRTPSFEQMYFWIATKYPSDILWMEYTTAPDIWDKILNDENPF